MSDRSWIATRDLRAAAYRERAQRVSNDKIEIEVHLHKATPKTVRVSDDGDSDRAVWLPLSQISVDENAEEGETTTIVVPEWLAQREGLI